MPWCMVCMCETTFSNAIHLYNVGYVENIMRLSVPENLTGEVLEKFLLFFLEILFYDK